MGLEGAALLAAAIRAAIQAKAPRRTVQAVAAAVTGVLWRPTAATEPQVDARAQAGTPVAEVRADRRAQRQRKKDRRRDAAAKAPNAASSIGPVVLQCDTVRAAGSSEVAVAAIAGWEAIGSRRAKRRKKGGRSDQSSGALGARNVESLSGAEVLQCVTVRASSPMDTADEDVGEVLDDYWADYATDEGFVTFMLKSTKFNGLQRDAIIVEHTRRKRSLVSVKSAHGQGSSMAARCLADIDAFEMEFGFHGDPGPTVVARRDG
jgi:hypothetical protein